MFDEFDIEYSKGWDKLAREFETKREELLKNCIEKRRKSILENIKKAREKEIGRCINCNTLVYEDKPHKVGIFPVDGLFPFFCNIDCVKEWHDKNKLNFSEIEKTEEEEFYEGTTILGESKLINHAAEAMKNFNEVMEISKRIWDIIDDCIKKAKENA